MPRPDSKILADAGDAADTSNADTLVSKSRAKRVAVQSAAPTNVVSLKPVTKVSAEDKAAAKQAAADAKAAEKEAAAKAKADLVAKKADLKAALAQARAPLDGIETDIKAAVKAAVEIQRVYDRAAADRDKAMKVNTKQLDTLNAKKTKFEAAFEKAKAKIDAQLAKLG